MAGIIQALSDCREARVHGCSLPRMQHPKFAIVPRLLRQRRDRQSRRATEQRDELPSLHSITSSARASSDGDTSRPSALAVLRLMTNSTFVGCSIGKSEGLVPLKILST